MQAIRSDHAMLDVKPCSAYTVGMDTTSSLPMLGFPDAHTQPILGLDTNPVLEGDDVAKKPAVKPAPKIVASHRMRSRSADPPSGSHGWRLSPAGCERSLRPSSTSRWRSSPSKRVSENLPCGSDRKGSGPWRRGHGIPTNTSRRLSSRRNARDGAWRCPRATTGGFSMPPIRPGGRMRDSDLLHPKIPRRPCEGHPKKGRKMHPRAGRLT